MERMENLFEQKSSSTAYKAQAQTLLEELTNFSTPTQHTRAVTRLMIFMRALIFSSDTTTQSATANMLKVYLATRNTELPALQEYVARHGSPPHITGIEEVHGDNLRISWDDTTERSGQPEILRAVS